MCSFKISIFNVKNEIIVQAKPLMESEKIEELADPNLEGKYEMDQMHRLVLTASYCVRQSSIWRPSMTEVQYTLLLIHFIIPQNI